MDSLYLKQLDSQSLHQLFLRAYKAVSETSYKFKQDTLLYFYAYYKKATEETETMRISNIPVNGEELVNAFKANALIQAKRMSQDEAKQNYILLAHEYSDFSAEL